MLMASVNADHSINLSEGRKSGALASSSLNCPKDSQSDRELLTRREARYALDTMHEKVKEWNFLKRVWQPFFSMSKTNSCGV